VIDDPVNSQPRPPCDKSLLVLAARRLERKNERSGSAEGFEACEQMVENLGKMPIRASIRETIGS